MFLTEQSKSTQPFKREHRRLEHTDKVFQDMTLSFSLHSLHGGTSVGLWQGLFLYILRPSLSTASDSWKNVPKLCDARVNVIQMGQRLTGLPLSKESRKTDDVSYLGIHFIYVTVPVLLAAKILSTSKR